MVFSDWLIIHFEWTVQSGPYKKMIAVQSSLTKAQQMLGIIAKIMLHYMSDLSLLSVSLMQKKSFRLFIKSIKKQWGSTLAVLYLLVRAVAIQ